MNYFDYVIDFERLNELTFNKEFDTSDSTNPFGGGTFAYRTTRKILNEYTDYYQQIRSNKSRHNDNDKIEHIINTLLYNKILIHKSELRDIDIDKLLEDYERTI